MPRICKCGTEMEMDSGDYPSVGHHFWFCPSLDCPHDDNPDVTQKDWEELEKDGL